MRLARRWLAATCLCLGLSLPGGAWAAGVVAGQSAPPVALPLLSGDGELALAALRGKVVYLDFWASWCGPCRVSFPVLEQLRSELGPRGFEVYAIGVDENVADARAFLQEIPVSYPVVHDGSGATPAAWGILGMPTGYLIDRDGVVREVHQGFRKSDAAGLRAAVSKLLGE